MSETREEPGGTDQGGREGLKAAEKSLYDLLSAAINRRVVCRSVLAASGLYFAGTGIHGYVAAGQTRPLMFIRLALGAGLLAAPFFIRSTRGGQARGTGRPDRLTTGANLQFLRRHFANWRRWASLPLACLLILSGSWCLHKPVALVQAGLLGTTAGLVLLIWALRREGIDLRRATPAGASDGGEHPETTVRWRLATAALALSAGAYTALPENRFTLSGTALWAAGIAAWAVALWDGPLRFAGGRLGEALARGWREGIHFSLRATHWILLGLILVTAVFRLYRLDAVPGEMTSEHVEDLLAADRILNQQEYPIFDPAIGGREPLGLYFTALAARLPGVGLTHRALKIVGAVAGLLTLVFIYFLAREVMNDGIGGLCALSAAGIAWWPNVMARLGARVAWGACFSALALWLVIRAVKRGRRNAALLSGLATGLGMYACALMWILPVAVTVALIAYGLSGRQGGERRKAIRYGWVSAVLALAVAVPVLRYHLEHREEFRARIEAPVWGDADDTTGAILARLMRNEWDSLRMFHWTGDDAWVAGPPGQPALDWVMAALLVLGVAFVIHRYWRYRDWLDFFLLLSAPLLLLPSTLVLVFEGRENPSLQRSSAAIPIVFVLIGLALLLLLDPIRRSGARRLVYFTGAGLAAAALATSACLNWRIVFDDYARNYSFAAQNASQIGRVIRGFAESVGSYDTAFVKSYPHWADVRAVGIYAGKWGWEQSICDTCLFRDARVSADDPRAKLFIVHPGDREFVASLREVYPQGSLSVYRATDPRHDFLIFAVPGRPDTGGAYAPPP